MLLVEGKDVGILKRIQNVLLPDSIHPLDAIPNMSIGGWSGWNYAIGTSMTLKNAVGEEVIPYCVLDSDYHTEKAKSTRQAEAKEKNVRLHIWKRKEIENYLLVPELIHRMITSKIKRGPVPTLAEVSEKLSEIANGLEHEVFDALSAKYYDEDRLHGVAEANRKARAEIKKKLASTRGWLDVASGKTILGKISEWSQVMYGVSFGAIALASAITRQEIDSELKEVISAIEAKRQFAP
jgi:hypothetical protein